MLSAKSFFLLAASTYAAVHDVDVGEDGLVFEPQTLNPAVGDTVIFHLYPRHNVASGPFSNPCTPGDSSFFSGSFANTNNGDLKFVVNVTSTDPVYYYCAVPSHCAQGMVGGWNIPTSGDTIEAYASAGQSVNQASAPSSVTGGTLVDDAALASLTATAASGSASGSASAGSASASTTPGASGASSTPAASGSASGSETAASPTSSGAAQSTGAASPLEANAALAALFGAAAYFL